MDESNRAGKSAQGGGKCVVAIDGPSGSGKSTVARLLAAKLDYTYLDTGAMYRAVAFRCRELGVAAENTPALAALLAEISLVLLPPAAGEEDVRVLLNDRELGQDLRTAEMGLLASQVSALPLVRSRLTELQQQLGAAGRIVAEGRDTGTVVFPDARWKFYLDAAPEIRAARRAAQLRSRGETVDEALLLEQIRRRDQQDRERTIAPLQAAPDAICIDSGTRCVEEILTLVHAWIAEDGAAREAC